MAPVAKQWAGVDGRRFLVESVEYPALKPLLDTWPQAAVPQPPQEQIQGLAGARPRPVLPRAAWARAPSKPPAGPAKPGATMQMARADTAAGALTLAARKGVVLHYDYVYGTNLFTYRYDANGRLTNRWTPSKGKTRYAYDAASNLTQVDYPASPDLTLAYDANHRLTNMTDAVGTTRLTYTPFGALLAEDGPWDSDTVSYAYDNRRRRSGLSLAQPNAPAWVQSYAYDAVSRLTNVTSPAGLFGYQ